MWSNISNINIEQLVRPKADIALQFQLTHNLHLSGTLSRFSNHKHFQFHQEKLLQLLFSSQQSQEDFSEVSRNKSISAGGWPACLPVIVCGRVDDISPKMSGPDDEYNAGD